ncbi:MAG TPA: hypothetical protein VIY98_03285 [Nitrososphaeraceae archaeon]
MHKSAYKFGISLMASLIVLSTVEAAIPMSNINLFSDAIASGKHSDKNDNYHKYESYYSNDKQYTPDYNYYYEPMNQYQQQQSNYDNNDNNYGYEDTKKISYSRSYEDMKTYSTYPTKDKKYVCQKGQFEGFFVESVEFCKLKIPAGPQGPQGPQGPAGPDGQINFTNTYLVTGNRSTTGETPSRAFSVAFCDPGDIVLEGGGGVGAFTDGGLGNVFLLIREPVNEGNGYRVGGVAANSTEFDSNAICIDNPPLR